MPTGLALIEATFTTLRNVLFVVVVIAAVTGLMLAALTPGENIVGDNGIPDDNIVIAAPVESPFSSMPAF